MRAQSLRAATRCETAKGRVCHCRCGGQLHGAMRNLIEEDRAVPGFFEALPEDDPHRVPSEEEKRRMRKLARQEKKYRDQGQVSLFTE